MSEHSPGEGEPPAGRPPEPANSGEPSGSPQSTDAFGDVDERIRALRRHSPNQDEAASQPAPIPSEPDQGRPEPSQGSAAGGFPTDDWTPGQASSDDWRQSIPTSSEAAAAPGERAYPSGWPDTAGAVATTYDAPAERRSIRQTAGRHLREIAETIILALLIFLVVRAVVQNFQVEGSSMEPTLESSWYLLVNKAAYWEVNLETLSKFIPFLEPGDDPTRYIFGGPDRGDVIVFIAPDQVAGQPERDFIKRIIGLPGETVEIKDCTVFVNGEPLDEPYILSQTSSSEPPVVVPPDHYYVLGDNRDNSRDSRAPDIGMIPKESIIGKAWVTYWPFDVLGFVDSTSAEPGAGFSDTDKTASAQGVPACS